MSLGAMGAKGSVGEREKRCLGGSNAISRNALCTAKEEEVRWIASESFDPNCISRCALAWMEFAEGRRGEEIGLGLERAVSLCPQDGGCVSLL